MVIPGKAQYIVDGIYIVESSPVRCKRCDQEHCEHEQAVLDYLDKGGEPAKSKGSSSPIACREAEEAVIAGLILAPDKLNDVKGIITDRDFGYYVCAEAYRGILKAEKVGIDYITVSQLCDVPASYLMKMAESLPFPMHMRSYALIIKSTAIRREIVRLASALASVSFDDSIPLKEIKGHVIPEVIASLRKL